MDGRTIFTCSESAGLCLLIVVVVIVIVVILSWGEKVPKSGQNDTFWQKLNKISFVEVEKLMPVPEVTFWPPRSFEDTLEAI